MNKFIIVWGLLISINGFSQEQLTLMKAIATALDNNYGIKIAKNSKSIAENNVTYGNAGFLPTLTANFNRTYGIQSYEQVRANSDTSFTLSDDGVRTRRQTYGVNLNWTIFDGFRMFRRYNQLEEISLQSDDQLRNEIETLVFNVSIAFYQAALENERLRLSENNIKLSEERLRVSREKYELGKASKLEYLQAQVDLNSDKSAQIRQLELLDLRKLELLNLMVLAQDSIDFQIAYQLERNEPIDLADITNSVETSNPQLMVLRRDQAIALYEKEISKSDRFPEVSLFASYTESSSENPASFAVENKSNDINYGITASWVLFDGFNVNRRVQNARIIQESSQYAYEEQLNSLVITVRSRYINYKNNLNLMELESENIEVAKENNDIAQERYRIGLSNPVELREAQINLINAELRFQNAAFAAKLVKTELLYLSGQLLADK